MGFFSGKKSTSRGRKSMGQRPFGSMGGIFSDKTTFSDVFFSRSGLAFASGQGGAKNAAFMGGTRGERWCFA